MAHDQGLNYPNRKAAGQDLAARLGDLAGRGDTLVLALPRGGLPVAAEVARALGAPLELRGKCVVLVDDGIATGAMMEAAAMAARAMGAAPVVIAVPVAAPDTMARLAAHADRIVCPQQQAGFMAVGQFYESFPQISDEEVVEQLAMGNARTT